MSYIKDYDAWSLQKPSLDTLRYRRSLHVGDIFWASLGVNVGSEIDGKGPRFTRPVLIISLIGDSLALVVPLSSTKKFSPGYFSLDFQGAVVASCVRQLRVISQNRIFDRMGKISLKKLHRQKEHIRDFFAL